MTGNALAKRERELFAPIEAAIPILPEGSLSLVGLRLLDVEMPYADWEQLGRMLGNVHRWTRWALGDWLNFGEGVFGEDAYDATEGTQADRYNVAERCTGLAHRTLVNYASVCSRIAVSRRRVELDFSVHEPVAGLPGDEQSEWLQKAVDGNWTRDQLRDEIAFSLNGADPEKPQVGPQPVFGVSGLEEAARRVFHQAQRTSDGGAIVPAEPWAQFVAVLGEGE